MPDTTLRAVPDVPPRALGLIRVSKERDGMVSPEIQRTAIEDYTATRGYDLRGWIEGIDESGSRAKSAWWPRLDHAIEQVEAGDYDVVVVWEFSRTARNRLRWAVAIDRVEAAGGRLESATERVDVTTSTGRFTRGMLGEINAWRADVIGDGWRDAHARRVRHGLPPTGKPKFGYVYDRDRQLHVPDSETGPLLAETYRRYIGGDSFHLLVRWLNDQGARTTAGGVWTDVTLRRVLDAGFASGAFRFKGDLVEGVHEPLISPEEWQAYQDRRETRRALAPQGERSEYLVSRLLRCGRCGAGMVGGARAGKDRPAYRCAAAKAKGSTACAGALVDVAVVDRFIYDWLTALAGEVDDAAGAAAEVEARKVTLKVNRDRLARQAAAAEDALTRLAIQHATTPLPPDVYEKAYRDLAGQLERLKVAVADADRKHRQVDLDPQQVAAGLLDGWHFTPVPVRREVLRSLVASIRVDPALDRGADGRVRSATRFEVATTWDA